jgi:F-type H+-transporting ATPase subunit gamma
MPTLLDYRRRIRSVKNTQQITRAMKFIAAARFRKAHEAVLGARPYAREILRILRSAVARVGEVTNPLLERRPEERILAVVLSGDRGLAGPFNANVIRFSYRFLREHEGKQLELITVGRKGRDALRKRGYKIINDYLHVSLNVNFNHAKEIGKRIIELYEDDQIDAAYLIYNEFKTVMTQNLRAQKLLPIEPAVFKADETEGGAPSLVDYIYEQPPAELFRGLLQRYIENELFRVLLESAAAEFGARMSAMESATKNAGDLIEKLTLDMNKIRQAAITRELIEIVSGAAVAAE